MQMTLRIGSPHTPPRAHARPVLKWAGGKSWLAPLISTGLHRHLALTHGAYIEPFAGSAAVALDLGLPGMVIGDANEDLVTLYTALADDAATVADALERLVSRGIDQETFLRVRAAKPRKPVYRAARLLYLNRLAYNGLYRVNRRGQVYADPPYDGAKTFAAYARGGFHVDDHARLAAALQRAAERGAAVLATNADTPRVRALYAWAEALPTLERRSVAARASSRGSCGCLLLTTDPSLINTKESPCPSTRPRRGVSSASSSASRIA